MFGSTVNLRARGPAAGLLAACLLCFCAPGLAAPTRITPVVTTLQSDAERMISYRHQEHMWQTADGATHLMINSGTLSPDGSLTLQTSLDNGQSWVQTLSLPNTDSRSTSDGVLVGDDLWVVYSSTSGTVLFTILHYDSTARTWARIKTEFAYGNSALRAINPALVIDSNGAVWCGIVTADRTTSDASIRMVQRAADGSGWLDTGLIFGTVDNISIERSARPVLITGGVGMIYTVHNQLFWAYRLNGAAPTDPWTTTTLFTSQAPYDTDPYASHFSVATDSSKNLHLAIADHGKVLYFRYAGVKQLWVAPKAITQNISANYVQVSIVRNTDAVAVFANDSTGSIRVYQSVDKGNTFTYADRLVHPRSKTNSYDNPRVESPGLASSPIPTVQQYVNGTAQLLLGFQVPAIGSP